MIALTKLRPYPADRAAISPNQGPRRGTAIQGIVLHATADEGNEPGSLSWMRDRNSQASCHLLILRDGTVIRLVPDAQRAWHAGVSSWRGIADVNSATLGIEIANRNDGEPYTDAQYRRLAEIGAWYCRQGLTVADFVSHAEIAPQRKTDPAGFDWPRFRSGVKARLEVEVPAITPALAGVPGPQLVTEPPHLVPVAVPAVAPLRGWSEPPRSLWARLTQPLRSINPMRTILSRIAAAIVAVVLTFVAGTLGVEVSPAVHDSLVEGVTLLGLGVWGIAYAVLHRLIDRQINPTDAAKHPSPTL